MLKSRPVGRVGVGTRDPWYLPGRSTWAPGITISINRDWVLGVPPGIGTRVFTQGVHTIC
eukprot:988956-Rhodomonas_salina.1